MMFKSHPSDSKDIRPMSSNPTANDSNVIGRSGSRDRIHDLFVGIDSGTHREEPSSSTNASQSRAEDFLRAFLGNLCDTSKSQAAILWVQHRSGFRWSASHNLHITDSNRESPYTNDVVANVDLVFKQGETDIFTCDGTDGDLPREDAMDPILRDLVLDCRQLLLPLHRAGNPFAVVVLFQPTTLGEKELWSLDDLLLIQKGLNQRIEAADRAELLPPETEEHQETSLESKTGLEDTTEEPHEPQPSSDTTPEVVLEDKPHVSEPPSEPPIEESDSPIESVSATPDAPDTKSHSELLGKVAAASSVAAAAAAAATTSKQQSPTTKDKVEKTLNSITNPSSPSKPHSPSEHGTDSDSSGQSPRVLAFPESSDRQPAPADKRTSETNQTLEAEAQPSSNHINETLIGAGLGASTDSRDLQSDNGGDSKTVAAPKSVVPARERESNAQISRGNNAISRGDITAPQSRMAKAVALASVVGGNLHEDDCAYDIANEVRHYLGRGRVSVAVFRGSSCKIRAVSDQQVFDRRSAAIIAIEKLATLAAGTKRTWFHPEQDEKLPANLQTKFEQYYDATDAQSIALIPLLKRDTRVKDPENLAGIIRDKDGAEGKVVGVLIVEGLREPITSDDLGENWHLIESPVTNALANSRQHNSLFLMPVWRELGRFTDVFRGHLRNKALGIGAAILCAILALTLIPGEMKLSCEGVIQPTESSKIYAEANGVVSELLVNDGDWVNEGDLLLKLENPELLAEIAKVEGELRETKQKLRTFKLQRMRDDFSTPEEKRETIVASSGLEAKLEKLEEQFALLHEKEGQLVIKSPSAGRVFTWDTRRRLLSRPVEIGQNLLTIADARGPWELELRLPDKRSGYLHEKVHTPEATDGIKTSYVLASNPTDVKYGTVREVSKSADVDEELGNIVRVYADLDETPEESTPVRPGTEVIAQIHVGNASIGYCKLYEFFDWVNRTWFRFT